MSIFPELEHVTNRGKLAAPAYMNSRMEPVHFIVGHEMQMCCGPQCLVNALAFVYRVLPTFHRNRNDVQNRVTIV